MGKSPPLNRAPGWGFLNILILNIMVQGLPRLLVRASKLLSARIYHSLELDF